MQSAFRYLEPFRRAHECDRQTDRQNGNSAATTRAKNRNRALNMYYSIHLDDMNDVFFQILSVLSDGQFIQSQLQCRLGKRHAHVHCTL